MLLLKNKFLGKYELLRFIIVGSLNTIIGLGVIFILLYIGIDDYIANISGYIVGLCTGFFLHKYFTFKSKNKITLSEISRFLIIFLISYVVNITILYFTLFYMTNYLAQIFAMIGYTIVNYVLNKFITFRRII